MKVGRSSLWGRLVACGGLATRLPAPAQKRPRTDRDWAQSKYCLDSEHPRGRQKARVFASVGIQEADAEALRAALLAVATSDEARSVSPTRTASAMSLTSISSGRAERSE